MLPLLLAQTPPHIQAVPQPDVSLWLVLAMAALNPALIAVALWLGRDLRRRAPERPAAIDKLLLAGFVSGIAGIALIWLGAKLHVGLAGTAGRAAAGIFAVSVVTGAAWAAVGHRFWR